MSTQVESMFIEFIPFVGSSEWPGLEEFGGEKVIVNNTGFVDYAEKIDALENSDVVSHPYDDWADGYDWDEPLYIDDYGWTLYKDSQEQVEQDYPVWNWELLNEHVYGPHVYHQPFGAFPHDEQVQVESETIGVTTNSFGVTYAYYPCPF